MRFVFSWIFSYLKASLAAAVVLGAATLLVGFLRGDEVTPSLAAVVVFWTFLGVAVAALAPALLVSAAPELVGIGPNGALYAAVGAGFALAALAGVSLSEIQDAKLLESSQKEVTAWIVDNFDGVPKPQIAVFAMAGASAGGALARSRRRAMNRAGRGAVR
ncbi:MAG: hypothetical protein GC152_00375 [Alphaproteobacteria bacterium]|nr:hypothetical protein [Alphaproteobacteria bacterium]